MKKNICQHKVTATMVLISLVLLVLALFKKIDIFENLAELFEVLEDYEADEFFVFTFLVSIGLVIDFRSNLVSKKNKLAVQHQEIKVLKATMNNVLDIVNNFLNQTQLIRFEAETKGTISRESIKTLEALTFQTAEKLRQIAELDEVIINKTTTGLPLLALKKKDSE